MYVTEAEESDRGIYRVHNTKVVNVSGEREGLPVERFKRFKIKKLLLEN